MEYIATPAGRSGEDKGLYVLDESGFIKKPDLQVWADYINSLTEVQFKEHKVIIYHHNDMDGAFAAASAVMGLQQLTRCLDINTMVSLNFQCLDINYDRQGDLTVTDIVDANSSVFVLDFAFNRQVTDLLISKAGFFLTLDHHKTNQEALGQSKHTYFDMEASGAKMAFDYFLDESGLKVPLAITLADNRDLWKKTDGREDAFHEAAMAIRATHTDNTEFIIDIASMVTSDECTLEQIELGKAMLVKRDSNIKSACAPKRLIHVNMAGYPCVLFNYGIDQSDACQYLYEQEQYRDHIVGAFSFLANGTVNFSLRKGKKCTANLDEVAKFNYGGGGHKQAAGFNIPYERALRVISGKEKWAVSWKASEVDEIMALDISDRHKFDKLMTLDTQTLSRDICEKDTNWLQILPYITLQNDKGEYFCYQRPSTGEGEQRLAGEYSMGLGGHMDTLAVPGSVKDSIILEALRELHEEVHLDYGTYKPVVTDAFYKGDIRLIRIKDTEVESVHLGISVVIPVHELDVKCNEDEVIDPHWRGVYRLKYMAKNGTEIWSQIVAKSLMKSLVI